MTPRPDILILGCGFTGTEVARRAIDGGQRVIATTRGGDRRENLERLGVELHTVPALTADLVRAWVSPNTRVLVAFAPDGRTDAEIAPVLARAASVVYLSTTGVYGAHRGRVDETTLVDASEPRARERIQAERHYRGAGATVLRAAGIYGPGRGLHLRVQSGTFRVPGDGTNVVSRIHVADLAQMVLGVFRRAHGANEVGDANGAMRSANDEQRGGNDEQRGMVFVAADDAPVPQIEAIAWLSKRLGVPMPPHVTIDDAPPTLRHDRAVDNRRIKAWTRISLLYPSYREGFEACIAEDEQRAGG